MTGLKVRPPRRPRSKSACSCQSSRVHLFRLDGVRCEGSWKGTEERSYRELGVTYVGGRLARPRDECFPDKQALARCHERVPTKVRLWRVFQSRSDLFQDPDGLGQASGKCACACPRAPWARSFTSARRRETARVLRQRNKERTFEAKGNGAVLVKFGSNGLDKIHDGSATIANLLGAGSKLGPTKPAIRNRPDVCAVHSQVQWATPSLSCPGNWVGRRPNDLRFSYE
jgi:hypothetical protein